MTTFIAFALALLAMGTLEYVSSRGKRLKRCKCLLCRKARQFVEKS